MRLSLAAALTVLALAAPARAQFASETDRREALRHYRAGVELMSSERFERAIEQFDAAIQRDRLLTAAHYGRGQAFMELRRYASAIQAFTECRDAFRALHDMSESSRVAVERQRDDTIREMKDTLRRMQNVPNQQLRIANLERLIDDLDRQRTSLRGPFVAPAEVSLALGSGYFRGGRLEDAEREWKAAATADPALGEAHNNLAALYAMAGNKSAAQEAVRAAEKARFRVNPRLKEDIEKLPANR